MKVEQDFLMNLDPSSESASAFSLTAMVPGAIIAIQTFVSVSSDEEKNYGWNITPVGIAHRPAAGIIKNRSTGCPK